MLGWLLLYRLRPVRDIFLHLRLIDLKLVIFHRLSGNATFLNGGRGNGFAYMSFDVTSFGTSMVNYMAVVISSADIIDHLGIVDDRNIVRVADVVIIDVSSSKIPVADERPVIGRYIIIIAVPYCDADTRAKRRPAVITFGSSPGHPSRAPLVIGNPHGSVVWVVIPATIVKRRPSPWIIRNPCPSLIGIYPVAVSGIGNKSGSNIGSPDISIIRTFKPRSIGA